MAGWTKQRCMARRMDFERRWSLGSTDACAEQVGQFEVRLSVCQLSVDIIMVGTKYAHVARPPPNVQQLVSGRRRRTNQPHRET